MTRGELLSGLKLEDGAHRLAQLIDQFLLRVQCLPWDEATATQFASIAADLHFSRVAGLAVENWPQAVE